MSDEPQPLRFDSVPRDSTRWERAQPGRANVMRVSWDRWVVHIPDSDRSDDSAAHVVTLRVEGDQHVGACDCAAYAYDGICAHLCTIRKGAVIDARDRSGRPVEIPSSADRFSGAVDHAMRADGRGEQP